MPGTTSIRSWTRTRACAAPRSWVGSLLLPVLMLLEWSPLAAGWGGGGGIRGLAGGSSGLRLLLIAGSCVRAQLPRAPTTLAVPYVRESSIALEWEAVEGAQAYRVWSQYEEGGAAFSVFKDIFAAPFSAPSNSTVLTGLIYGRPLYLKIASGTAEGVFDAGSSPVVRATPLAPPEQAVQSVSLVSYGAQSVTLSWGLAGASTTTSAGPPASVFAILYSCTASNTVEKLHPIDFDSQVGTIVPTIDFVVGVGECTFKLLSRNLNYEVGNPWGSTALSNNRYKQSGSFFISFPSLSSAASDVAVSAATLHSLTLSWTAGDNALQHRVSYTPVSGGTAIGETVVFLDGSASTFVEVTGLTLGTSYKFRVQSRNKHVSGYEAGVTFTSRVEGVPAAPLLSIGTVSFDRVEVLWSMATSVVQPLYFDILYSQGGAVLTASTAAASATLSPLVEGVELFVEVRARNLYASGPYSNVTQTPLRAPIVRTAAVNATRAAVRSEQSVAVAWLPVNLADRFSISIKADGGAYAALGLVYTGTSAVVTGLVASTAYTVKVFAGNRAGYETTGRESNSVTTTAVGQPLSGVTGLRVAGVTTFSVLITWERPPSGDNVTVFRVEQSGPGLAATAQVPLDVSENATAPSFNATDLMADQNYTFTVTPRSANALGFTNVPSASVTGLTVSPPNAAAHNLRVTRITPTSVFLAWTRVPPPVTLYKVEGIASPGGPEPSREIAQPDASGDVTFEFTGLNTSSVYAFRVTARNLNSRGYASVPFAEIGDVGLIGLPEPVLNLRVSGITDTSISLTWERASSAPVASVFRVTYREGTGPFETNGLPDTTSEAATVTGLSRGTMVDLRVYAGTLAGFEARGSVVVSAAPVSKPMAVTAVRIVEIAMDAITLQWDPALFPRSTLFRVSWGVDGASAETSDTMITATGLETGVPVQFTIYSRNFNDGGYETLGMSAVVTPIQPPGYVTTLEVKNVTATSVTLCYSPGQLVNVTRAKIQIKRATREDWADAEERQCRVDEQFVDAAPSCGTCYTISSLVVGVVYNFRALQRNSNVAGFRTQDAQVVTGTPVFKPTRSVSNLRVVGVTTEAVYLLFDEPEGVDKPLAYKVLYRPASGGVEEESMPFPAGVQPVNVSGLMQDEAYSFRIIGRNLNDQGYTSAVRSAAIVAAPIEKPSVVGEIRVPGLTGTSVSLEWDPPQVGLVEHYQIEVANQTSVTAVGRINLQALGVDLVWNVLGTIGNVTRFEAIQTDVLRFESGVPLLFRVSARNVNLDGFSDASQVLATPTAPPQKAPTQFQVASVTTKSVFLTWTPPEGYYPGDPSVTTYKLEGCAINCGSDEPFPPLAEVGQTHFVAGGAEYQWSGIDWVATGVTYWRTVAVVPYSTVALNVTNLAGQALVANQQYQFRVSAGNLNTRAFGPTAVVDEATPVPPPGPAREVVVSNPRVTQFALNFVPPLISNTTGPATRYRVQVTEVVSGYSYAYHEILTGTSVLASGFLPGTSYKMTIFAGNLGGYDKNGAVSIRTVKTLATPCTTDCCEEVNGCTLCCGLQARRVTSTSVELVWTAPSNIDRLKYSIVYRGEGSTGAYTSAGTFNVARAVIGPINGFQFVNLWRFRILGGDVASGLFDSSQYEGVVLVLNSLPPNLVVTVEIASVSQTSVFLKWTRPIQPFTVLEIVYAVEVSVDGFALSGQNNSFTIKPIPDPQLGAFAYYNVTGLARAVTYDFRILAKTPFSPDFLDSQVLTSNVVSARPAFAPPSVESLRVTTVTLDSVVIEWDPPAGFVISEYRISWTPGTNVTTISGDATRYNATGLIEGLEYLFRVEARNLNAEGFENGTTVLGSADGPPPPPINPRLVQFYSDAVELAWNPSPSFPLPVTYEIQCRLTGANPVADALIRTYSSCLSGPASAGAAFVPAASVDASTTFARVAGLADGYLYQFRVCAVGVNIQRAAEQTCSDFVPVAPGPPPFPAVLNLSSVTATSVTLYWTPSDSAESWSFVPGLYQPGGDIVCAPGKTVVELQVLCEQDGQCEGFTTDGCLKSRVGFEAEWIAYDASPSPSASALGFCCNAAGDPVGYKCTAAGQDFRPKPACGCNCKGIWKKNLQFLLQMADPPSPFANKKVVEGERFSTRVSKPPGCTSCSLCPKSCVEIPLLLVNRRYEFRVFTRSLNGLGYSSASSAIIDATPVVPPVTAVVGLALRHTTETSATVEFTGIAGDVVIGYSMEISLDGSTWLASLDGVSLPGIPHAGGTLSGTASGLTAGTEYHIRVLAVNLNSQGAGPPSNAVAATPFALLLAVASLVPSQVTACVTSACGCGCCLSNLCRGTGTVSLSWAASLIGPVTGYQVSYADVSDTSIVQVSDNDLWVESAVVPASSRSHTVVGLSLGRAYAFRVRARSDHIDRYMGDCLSTTAPGYPCPTIVSASPYMAPTTSVSDTLVSTDVTATSVGLRFACISSEPVTMYQVYYGTDILAPAAERFAEFNHINNGSITTRVQQLTPGTPYFFTITPRNLNGDAYRTCPTSAANLVQTDLGAGGYRLAWEKPAGWAYTISSYRVWYQANSSAAPVLHSRYQVPATTVASTMELIAAGLPEGPEYTFFVTPDAGPCAMIGPIVPTAKPEQVGNFMAVRNTQSSIEFEWTPPGSDSDGVPRVEAHVLAISNYTSPCEHANYTVAATLPASVSAYLFTGLYPQVRYCFRIHAINRHTEGLLVNSPAFADATPVQLPETQATALRVVSKYNLINQDNGALVSLAWTTPIPNGGPVERYLVAYWPQSDEECLQQGTETNCRSYQEFSTVFKGTAGTITGLRPATNYFFVVFSGNLNGFERVGSPILGPVETSMLPGAVTGLQVTSITDTSLTLEWRNPANPVPSKMRLEYLVIETGVLIQEEVSCTTPYATCPSTKVWTGLSAAFSYRFFIYTGGPNDPEVDLSVTETYTGLVSVEGAPYETPPAPAALTLESWSDFTVTLLLSSPLADAAGGPVSELFLEGRASLSADWAPTSAGPSLSPPAGVVPLRMAIGSIGGVPLALNDFSNATEYNFRLSAGNLVGNSSFIYLEGVRLYLVPSLVRELSSASTVASLGGIHLSWLEPVYGTGEHPPAAGNGFNYKLEVSDDGGVSFFEDPAGALALSANNTRVAVVNRAQPELVSPGRAYISRIAARNRNVRGLGVAAYHLAFPPLAPRPVESLRLLSVDAVEATLAWDPPPGTPSPPVPSTLAVTYDAHAAIYSGAPLFLTLPPPFANLSSTTLSFTRTLLTDAVSAVGGDVSLSPSRFLLRVVPRNAAGVTVLEAESVEVRFEGLPEERVAGLVVSEVTATSATLEWTAPTTPASSLTGFEVRLSTDGLSYASTQAVSLTRRQASDGAIVPSTQSLLPGLVGQYWFQVLQQGETGVSKVHASAGPTLVSSFVGPVENLRVASVTMNSALLAWSLPEARVAYWEVTYSTTTTGPVIESSPPRLASTPSLNVTALPSGVLHTFFVRSRSASGLSAPVSVQGTPVQLPGAIASARLLSASPTSINFAWAAPPAGAPPEEYRVWYARENSDGDVTTLIQTESSDAGFRSISGLDLAAKYRVEVRAANAHELDQGAVLATRFSPLAPPPAPYVLRVTAVRSSSLSVQWEAVTNATAISFFNLSVSGEVLAATASQFHPPGSRLADIQTLQPGRAYSIALSACNLAGCSAPASLSSVVTAPRQVGNVRITGLSTTGTVTVAWDAPSPPLDYLYYLRYRRMTIVGVSEFVLFEGRIIFPDPSLYTVSFSTWVAESLAGGAGKYTNATLSGLTLNEAYQLELVAQVNGIRGGSVQYLVRPSDQPSNPALATFTVSDDAHSGVLRDSLTIQFAAPTGQVVTHYRMTWCEKLACSDSCLACASTQSREVTFLEGNSLPSGKGTNFHTFTSLTVYKEIIFELETRNLNAQGYSTAMRMATDVVPLPIPVHQPGRVQSLRVTSASRSEVIIKWSPPPGADPAFFTGMSYQISYAPYNRTTGVVTGAFTTPTAEATATATIAFSTNPTGELFAFDVQARNKNALSFGVAQRVIGGPRLPCDPSASPPRPCLVRNLRAASYEGGPGAAVSIIMLWDLPLEGVSDTTDHFYYKVETVEGGTAYPVTLTDLAPETPFQEITETNGVPLAINNAYTVRVTARNLNDEAYGTAVDVAVTIREQPSAMVAAPVVIGISSSTVTLSWTQTSAEYSFKVVSRLVGSDAAFTNPIFSYGTSGTVTGLENARAYEFKVFQRNLNKRGFEGFGSPTVQATTRPPLGAASNVHISHVTETTVTFSWGAPLPNYGSASYKLKRGSTPDNLNTTVADGSTPDLYSGADSGLTLGVMYYYSLEACDLGGCGVPMRMVARTIGDASEVTSLVATAKDASDTGLSWEAPTTLSTGGITSGLSVARYDVEMALSASGPYSPLGSSSTTSFNHAGITTNQITFYYRVAPVIEQAAEFGYVLNPGTTRLVSLFFGTAPAFSGHTPPDGAVIVAQKTSDTVIPLQATSPDVPTVTIGFRTTGSTPQVARFTPSVPIVNLATKEVSQNLTIAFDADLAGSEYYVCLQGEDSNGLRTSARCYTIILPRLTPRLLSPPNETVFEARVGCVLQVGITAEDRTSANIAPSVAANSGFGPEVVALSVLTDSQYRSSISSELPTGATLDVIPFVQNPVTVYLKWRPVKGQEGFSYRFCFTTSVADDNTPPLCVFVRMIRCQFCARPADSLQSMAKLWHTTWTEIWSGNHMLFNPDLVVQDQVVSVGPTYTVRPGDDLDHLAMRYGVDTADLLLWNPDLADDLARQSQYQLYDLQEMCVVPQSCVYAASVSSYHVLAAAL